MKRFLTVLLSLFLGATALAFAACADNAPNGNVPSDGSGQTAPEEPDTPVGPGENDIPDTPVTPDADSNILIVYFSATGNTARLANYIHDRIGGDLIEIQPEVPYTSQDLNYSTPNMRPRVEHDTNDRPGISQDTYDAIDIGQYDTILIGFPIWWYVEPRIVDTFLESHNFSGKTVIPFATSGGSGIERAEKRMKELCPAARWRSGSLVSAGSAAAWARHL